MKYVPITVEQFWHIDAEEVVLRHVGEIAGECYNSSRDTDKCIQRALNCIKRGHHSPWEHVNITLRCTVDRGVSHALVRHRHCAFQQSSTIYQKFDEIVVIDSEYMSPQEKGLYRDCEHVYQELLRKTNNPSYARNVLPNNLATNLIITTNIRQWMYMIQRRCGPGDSENMHIWCQKTREWFEQSYPQVTKAFDDWYSSHPL